MNTAFLVVIDGWVSLSWINSASLSRQVISVSQKAVGWIGCLVHVGMSMVCIGIHIMTHQCHQDRTAEVVGILEIDRIRKANKVTKEFLHLRSRGFLDSSRRIVGAV